MCSKEFTDDVVVVGSFFSFLRGEKKVEKDEFLFVKRRDNYEYKILLNNLIIYISFILVY